MTCLLQQSLTAIRLEEGQLWKVEWSTSRWLDNSWIGMRPSIHFNTHPQLCLWIRKLRYPLPWQRPQGPWERSGEARRDIQPLNRVLDLPHWSPNQLDVPGTCPNGSVQEAFYSGGQTTSAVSYWCEGAAALLRVSPDIWAPHPSGGNWFHLLVSVISFFQSVPKACKHRWE